MNHEQFCWWLKGLIKASGQHGWIPAEPVQMALEQTLIGEPLPPPGPMPYVYKVVHEKRCDELERRIQEHARWHDVTQFGPRITALETQVPPVQPSVHDRLDARMSAIAALDSELRRQEVELDKLHHAVDALEKQIREPDEVLDRYSNMQTRLANLERAHRIATQPFTAERNSTGHLGSSGRP